MIHDPLLQLFLLIVVADELYIIDTDLIIITNIYPIRFIKNDPLVKTV